jgi:hypothetical protein
MDSMGWTRPDLDATPMYDVLSILLILDRKNIQAKQEERKRKNAKKHI